MILIFEVKKLQLLLESILQCSFSTYLIFNALNVYDLDVTNLYNFNYTKNTKEYVHFFKLSLRSA